MKLNSLSWFIYIFYFITVSQIAGHLASNIFRNMVGSPILQAKKDFFCKYCVLFAPTSVGAVKCSQTAGKLVSTPLTKFNKLTGKDGVLTNHEQSTFHKSSIETSQNFKLTCSNPSVDIRNQLSKQRDDQVSIKWLSNIF